MQIERLRWACRRGMLELDLILNPFLNKHFADLNDDHKQKFERLLKEEDNELFAWLMCKSSPEDADLKEIVDLIVSRKYDA